MNRASRVIALSVMAALPLLASAQQNWKPVTVDEMKREIVGKPMATVLANRSEGVFTMFADGKVTYRGNNALEGTWRASEKGYCTTYPNRGEACFEIVRVIDGTFEVYTDKGQFQGKMRPK